MIHYKKYYGDTHAACGSLIHEGESTIYPNSVQCPACRAKIRKENERQMQRQECKTLAEFDTLNEKFK